MNDVDTWNYMKLDSVTHWNNDKTLTRDALGERSIARFKSNALRARNKDRSENSVYGVLHIMSVWHVSLVADALMCYCCNNSDIMHVQ